MCFVAEDGYATIWNQTNHVARKQHRCCECGGAIHPGERYHLAEYLFDGSWWRDRWCERCQTVRQLIHDHEIAEGCHEAESWPFVGQLRDSLTNGDGYGLLEYNREYGEWRPARPEVEHMFASEVPA